jgi:hypothetical protein
MAGSAFRAVLEVGKKAGAAIVAIKLARLADRSGTNGFPFFPAEAPHHAGGTADAIDGEDRGGCLADQTGQKVNYYP